MGVRDAGGEQGGCGSPGLGTLPLGQGVCRTRRGWRGAAQPGRAWRAETERGFQVPKSRQPPPAPGGCTPGGPRLVDAASLPGGGQHLQDPDPGPTRVREAWGALPHTIRPAPAAASRSPAVPCGDVGLCLLAGRSARPFCAAHWVKPHPRDMQRCPVHT